MKIWQIEKNMVPAFRKHMQLALFDTDKPTRQEAVQMLLAIQRDSKGGLVRTFADTPKRIKHICKGCGIEVDDDNI